MSFLDQLDNSIGGALPSQLINQLLERNVIRTSVPIAENQVQPASIDLRLGDVAWRVRASFLPGKGPGVVTKTVTVLANTQPNRETLRFRAEIINPRK